MPDFRHRCRPAAQRAEFELSLLDLLCQLDAGDHDCCVLESLLHETLVARERRKAGYAHGALDPFNDERLPAPFVAPSGHPSGSRVFCFCEAAALARRSRQRLSIPA